MVCTKVLNVKTRPIDFVCDVRARRNMNNVKDLEVAMASCSGSEQLPSPVPVPCVFIHKAIWENKSLQQKHAEVRWALEVLLNSVNQVWIQSPQGSCQSSLLEGLEHGVKNHLHIVNGLGIQGDTGDSRPACFSQETQSVSQILRLYGRLLQGKLECLSRDLCNCATVQTPHTEHL
ncbi:erythropoietin-like isoform X2 [Osmerus eperlanus]